MSNIDSPKNYITVSYRLYKTVDGEKQLVEETKADYPFLFISGMGTALEAFEENIVPLAKGEKFNFTLTAEQAYGNSNPEYVLDLPKNIFEIDGKFDDEHIQPNKIIPLRTSDGQNINGLVVKINEETVTVDLNHPLAGSDLNFEGEVIENRAATEEEIKELIDAMNQQMNGGCSSCGDGNCDDNSCGGCCGE